MTDSRDPPTGILVALIAAGLIMVGGGLLIRYGGDCQGAAQSEATSPADINTTPASADPQLKGTQ